MQDNFSVPEIEARLFALGFRMEHSLATFDGEGHALVDISSEELVDPPNEEVATLAEAWTLAEGPSV